MLQPANFPRPYAFQAPIAAHARDLDGAAKYGGNATAPVVTICLNLKNRSAEFIVCGSFAAYKFAKPTFKRKK